MNEAKLKSKQKSQLAVNFALTGPRHSATVKPRYTAPAEKNLIEHTIFNLNNIFIVINTRFFL